MKKYLERQLEKELTTILNENIQTILDNVPVDEAPYFEDNTTMFMARAAIAVLSAATEVRDG